MEGFGTNESEKAYSCDLEQGIGKEMADCFDKIIEIIIPHKVSKPVDHCKDCCCARSWLALCITKYTGKSIPEHIAELRTENDKLKWHDVNNTLPDQGQYCYLYIPSVNTQTTFRGWYNGEVWHTTLKSHTFTNKVTHWQVMTLPTL